MRAQLCQDLAKYFIIIPWNLYSLTWNVIQHYGGKTHGTHMSVKTIDKKDKVILTQ